MSNFLRSENSYQSESDYTKFEDSFQNNTTIKRLSLKRQPRRAVNHAGQPESRVSSSQWHSEESLSSQSSNDPKNLGRFSTTRGRPPLPPPHCSSLDNKLKSEEAATNKSQTPAESAPKPAARSLAAHRPNPGTDKNIIQTHTQVEKDENSKAPPQPQPRRRLASFGGVSSPGSLSPFTGQEAYDQNNNGNRSADAHLYSSLGSRGSTGNLKLGTQSSGRTTPVPSPGSMQLQHVRDQMVVALQRLKELEEQVKIIPILQVKISVLQEEKRQLLSQYQNQSDSKVTPDSTWQKSNGKKTSETKTGVKPKKDSKLQNDPTILGELRKLTEEVQTLEERSHEINRKGCSPLQDKKNTMSKPTRENKSKHTNQTDRRPPATDGSGDTFGMNKDRDSEIEAQQLLICALKERVSHLEAELKESALQNEMSRLKLELQAAGARNRADKACVARPFTVSTGTEAKPQTTSQGVGNHREVKDNSTGEAREMKTVGVSCHGPELKNVCTGPDEPMSQWEMWRRVETREKDVEVEVLTNTQGTMTEVKSCDVGTNTPPPSEVGTHKKYQSVACGDCSIDVIISEAKELVSAGMSTDPVRRADLGIMASPLTVSQRTNTVSSSVSRFTNTTHASNADSSTNTLLSTKDKHTNTVQTVSRSVFVGNRLRDAPDVHSVGVETLVVNALRQTYCNKVTRDTGVGFTNIHENFLVGLKTRNMASGPSHLPDPIKTRSIGVGDGRIQDLSVSASLPSQGLQQSPQSLWDPELNHYIEKMQKLLGEDGELLSENCSHQRSESFKMLCNKKVVRREGAEVHHVKCQPHGNHQDIYTILLNVNTLNNTNMKIKLLYELTLKLLFIFFGKKLLPKPE